MARYYFNVRNGAKVVHDGQGRYLCDIDAVRDQARLIARDVLARAICANEKLQGREVEVTDENGHAVYGLPVLSVLRVSDLARGLRATDFWQNLLD